MRSKFDEELNFLNLQLTEMGELISERVHGAVHALKDRDIKTAKFVMDNDDDVNDYERRIEERSTISSSAALFLMPCVLGP